MSHPPLPACPFCGGQPALTKLTCQGQGCGACTAYQVACTACQLGLPAQPTPEEATAAWRTGVTQALQVALALKVDITAAGQRLVAREGT